MTEKIPFTLHSKNKPEEKITPEEESWKRNSLQQKVKILSQQIGEKRLIELCDMLAVIRGEESIGKDIREILENKEIGDQMQILQQKSLHALEIEILQSEISLFIMYGNREKETKKDYIVNLEMDCINSGILHDGIPQQLFNEIQSVYELITSADKRHPNFIQKNPKGGPRDYFYTPGKEEKRVITTFFPNLVDTDIKIPFRVEHGLSADGKTQSRTRYIAYGKEYLALGKTRGTPLIKISFHQLNEVSEQELKSTLINETWHYLYWASVSQNQFLENSLQGQVITLGEEKIGLGKHQNGVNEFMSDVCSIQINPSGEIKRIYEHALSAEKNRSNIQISQMSPGYQFCTIVFSAILRELFGSEYVLLRDNQKLPQNGEGSEKYYKPEKLQKILSNPEKMKQIQKRYIEIGYDLACRLGNLKNSPTYTEQPIGPNTVMDVIKMDVLAHPLGNGKMKTKMPPEGANLFGPK